MNPGDNVFGPEDSKISNRLFSSLFCWEYFYASTRHLLGFFSCPWKLGRGVCGAYAACCFLCGSRCWVIPSRTDKRLGVSRRWLWPGSSRHLNNHTRSLFYVSAVVFLYFAHTTSLPLLTPPPGLQSALESLTVCWWLPQFTLLDGHHQSRSFFYALSSVNDLKSL